MTRIYLDHNATTPLHPEVAEAMAESLLSGYGNPSSIHREGREARRKLEDARESLARSLDVDPQEIIFTSGGTEANNLAILGAAASGKLAGRHLIATAFEHSAVLQSYRRLEAEGWEVTYLDPDGDGLIHPEAVAEALREDTALASVMAANNEVGSIQPIAAIGRILRERGIPFHCDAVQGLGKLEELRPREWQVDYMVFSAHKINGPKGSGALYARKGAPLQGLSAGGPHERRFRAGTENLPGIVGFGKAVEIWDRIGKGERKRLTELRKSLEAALLARLPGLVVNASAAPRLPNTLSITLPGCAADMMVMGMDMRDVALSAGSACSSGAVKYSTVLLAMGKGKPAASTSLRLSLGQGNREEEIAIVAERLAEVAESVRAS